MTSELFQAYEIRKYQSSVQPNDFFRRNDDLRENMAKPVFLCKTAEVSVDEAPVASLGEKKEETKSASHHSLEYMVNPATDYNQFFENM